MSDLPPKTLLALPASVGLTVDLPPQQAIPAELPSHLIDLAAYARAAAKAPNTRRSYDSAWRSFVAWCFQRRGTALPAHPSTVAGHLLELSQDRSVATLEVRLAAISERHVKARLPDPTKHEGVKEVLSGLRRRKGVQAKAPKQACTLDVIRKLIRTLDRDTLQGKRDAALLLVGFAGAFRRSTLVERTLADLIWLQDGVILKIGKEKQDQEGKGREVGISKAGGELCPVKALEDWLTAAEIVEEFSTTRPFKEEGPIFRGLKSNGLAKESQLTAEVVGDVVKSCCARAGLDERLFGGHSLRAGHVTEALLRGVAFDRIMSQTGHHSTEMVLRYKRQVDAIKGGSSSSLGLGEAPQKT